MVKGNRSTKGGLRLKEVCDLKKRMKLYIYTYCLNPLNIDPYKNKSERIIFHKKAIEYGRLYIDHFDIWEEFEEYYYPNIPTTDCKFEGQRLQTKFEGQRLQTKFEGQRLQTKFEGQRLLTKFKKDKTCLTRKICKTLAYGFSVSGEYHYLTSLMMIIGDNDIDLKLRNFASCQFEELQCVFKPVVEDIIDNSPFGVNYFKFLKYQSAEHYNLENFMRDMNSTIEGSTQAPKILSSSEF
ncbi:MAG: hypothetical protein KAS12_01650 [Candidatus Aenigmarchaeota archaeon]|nr:hypothetical protein [Candidatus Aenigmarchaeota archaeon]